MFEQVKIPNNYQPFIVAMDDTDSYEGMCTTYLGTKLFNFLLHRPLVIVNELPYLIRLNPNIPHRTKGNGAVIIKGCIHSSLLSWFHSNLVKFILSFSMLEAENTNPGLVVWYGDIINELIEFGQRALWDFIEIENLNFFLKLKNVFYFHPKKKYGLIGCLAGIGLSQSLTDFTFELLVYRKPPYLPERFQNNEAVWKVNEDDYNLFSCVDVENKVIKIFPNGMDPVFCGIRGEHPENLLSYWVAIQPQPEMDCWMIFKSNQGTDSHILFTKLTKLDDPKFLPFRVINTVGIVDSNPITDIGGHVWFYFRNKNGTIKKKCYAYEPTKEFRTVIRQLLPGDEIEIGGNIRPAEPDKGFSEVINLEKVKILKLVEKVQFNNPICPQCSKRMESAGKNQPFRCKKCKTNVDKNNLETKLIQRNIHENQVYLPAINAQRHLTKPLKRKVKNQFDDKTKISLVLSKIFKQTI